MSSLQHRLEIARHASVVVERQAELANDLGQGFFVDEGVGPEVAVELLLRHQLAGTLEVQNIGFNLQAGDTFDLFDGTITDFGVFIQGPPGVSFSAVAADGTITVIAAPVPPEITGTSLVSGTNLVASGTGGTGFGNYRVLSSTNVAAPLASWTQVLTGTFEFDGSFNFTNVVDRAKPREFFILQGQ